VAVVLLVVVTLIAGRAVALHDSLAARVLFA
jgi:hypothetical protein